MLKKVIVGIPVMALMGLIAFVIFINLDSSDSTVGQEEVGGAVAANLDSGENISTGPKEYGLPIEKSRFGEPKDFVLAIHSKWRELEREEQVTLSADSESFALISMTVSEINYLRRNMDGAMIRDFDALQETAYKLTDPAAELSEKERKFLIPLFENQLNKLYETMMNR